MNSSPNDFVTVQMRGLKAKLLARAQVERVSVSLLVRRAIEREFALADPPLVAAGVIGSGAATKISIRLRATEVAQLDAGAQRAGLSRGAFVIWLLGNIPSLMADRGSRPDCLAALTASCAELSTLGRNVGRLTALLRHGSVDAAQEYRHLLDTLSDDVRSHLSLAASVLADVRPARMPIRHSNAKERT